MKKLIFILAFFAISAGAQSQTDTIDLEDIYELTLEEILNIKISTASKVIQKATDAPATVYVITAQQIEERNYASLKDLLRDIPQVEINEKASAETSDVYTINGVYGNEKFIILVDGIRANSSTGTPHTIDQSFSLANVKQVEVILGPASALYGADAFTGIINIITFKGNENSGIFMNSSYGLFNTLSSTLYGGIGNKTTSFAFNAKYYQSDEPFMPDYYQKEYSWYHHFQKTGQMLMFGDTITPALGVKPYATPTDAYNLRARLNHKKFEIGFTYFHESHSSSYAAAPYHYYSTEETVFSTQMQNLYIAHNYISENEKLSIRSNISAQEFEILPSSLYINHYSGYEPAYKYEQNQTIKWEEQINYQHSKKFTLVGGAMYEYVHAIPKTSDLPWEFDESKSIKEQKIYYPGTNITDSAGNYLTIYQDIYNVNYYNLGAYLQAQYTLFENFNITAGTRFDYNSRFNSTVNPRIGIVYKLISKITIKLLYGHAYLAPSPHFAYQYFGSFYAIRNTAGQTTGLASSFWRLINPDLQPEKRQSFDFQGIYQVSESFAVSLNGYYSTISNLIITQGFTGETFKDIPIDYVIKPVNAGEALTLGGTLRLDYVGKLTNNILVNIFAAYSYSDGNIADQPLILSAKNTVKTGFGLAWRNFNVYMNAKYVDGTHVFTSTNDQNVIVDAYTVIDASANYKIFENYKYKIGVFVSATNITDARYYNASNNEADFEFTPQDPLWVAFGLKLGLKR